MTIVVAVLVDYGEGQYRMVFGVECYEGYHFNNQPSQNSQTIINHPLIQQLKTRSHVCDGSVRGRVVVLVTEETNGERSLVYGRKHSA